MKTFSPVLIQLLLAGVLLAAGARIAGGSPHAPDSHPAPMAAAGIVPDAQAGANPPCVRVDLVGLGTLVGAAASLVLAAGKAADLVIRAWRGDPPTPQSG